MATTTPSRRVFPTPLAASTAAAAEIAQLIRSRSADERCTVLGLATGGTPVPLYSELVRLHREEGLSFARVITFNLDEYLGLGRTHPESYWHFMHHHLFDHVDIAPANVHIPDGSLAPADVEAACAAYEDSIMAAGGLDFQILGIGGNGHIGFNEPGATMDSRTRLIELNEITINDAAAAFGGAEQVPRQAITMGVATILAARRIALLAFGERKRHIVVRALREPVSPEVPATYLQTHPDVTFFLDEAAAGSPAT